MRRVTASTPASSPSNALETRINAWLRDALGLDEHRRVVRADAGSVLVSKFEPGFAARLNELLDALPELFDPEQVERAYARRAAEHGPRASRVAVWDGALRSLLAALGAERAIDDERQALVRVGIDSVRAVLDSVLWSGPVVGEAYEPLPGELAAYCEATARLDPPTTSSPAATGRSRAGAWRTTAPARPSPA